MLTTPQYYELIFSRPETLRSPLNNRGNRGSVLVDDTAKRSEEEDVLQLAPRNAAADARGRKKVRRREKMKHG